jgi:hypothetical protein
MYVEARKRRRRFYRTVGPTVLIGCAASLLVHSMMQGETADIPAGLQLLEIVFPVLLLASLCVGLFAYHRAVSASRLALARAGVPNDFIRELENYPTGKL